MELTTLYSNKFNPHARRTGCVKPAKVLASFDSKRGKTPRIGVLFPHRAKPHLRRWAGYGSLASGSDPSK